MTEEERIELELAEQARLNSGDWDSVAPGKAQDFGASFRRLIGLLAPHKWAFTVVSLLGAIGVVLSVIAPKVLAEATNIIFEGFISLQLPAGVTQAQVVEGLRAGGQQDLANIVEAATLTPGEGIDFVRLSQVVIIVLMLYVGASLLSWIQGY
ncbi:MAG: ABC transporter ATP-binding protein, partial [Actinomycetota bacterium]|nr:ABC transporter ATP-binding protein [Actinomycetota bacterium]